MKDEGALKHIISEVALFWSPCFLFPPFSKLLHLTWSFNLQLGLIGVMSSFLSSYH